MSTLPQNLPPIPSHRQPIELNAPERGYFTWIYDLLDYIGSTFFYDLPPPPEVIPLNTTASVDIFVKYVRNFQIELEEIDTLDFKKAQEKCFSRLRKTNHMEKYIQEWKDVHKQYDYKDVTSIIDKAQTIRNKVFNTLSEPSFPIPPPTPEAPNALSKPSPGMVNPDGTLCYLASLLQGLIGDPLTQRHIINGNLKNDPENASDINQMVDTLRRALIEYRQKQREEKIEEPLNFLSQIRAALTPLLSKTNENYKDKKQEDPADVLIEILGHIDPQGNPLFDCEIYEHLIFEVSNEQKQKLQQGNQALKEFENTFNQLDISQLKNYLQTIHSEADIPNLNTIPKVLKAILLQFIYKDISKIETKIEEKKKQYNLLQVTKSLEETKKRHQEKVEKINKMTQEDLVRELKQEVTQRKKTPQLINQQWIKENVLVQDASGYPIKEALQQVKLNGQTETPAFEDFIELAYQGLKNEEILLKYHENTDQKVILRCKQKHHRFKQTPQYLFFQLVRNAYDQQSYKESKKVHLKETFFLDPKHTKDGTGGEYRIRWFCVHLGSSANSGHYINYRLTEKGWYCHDDSTSKPANYKDVEEALQNCCLLFAERLDSSPNPQEISEKIKERQTEAKKESLSQRLEDLEKNDYGFHTGLKNQCVLDLFIDALSSRSTELEMITKIFSLLDASSQKFFKMILKKDKKWEEDKELNNQLFKLKEITTPYLTTKKKGHIVDQYKWIQEQCLHLQHTFDSSPLAVSDQTLLHEAFYRASRKLETLQQKLTYENDCLEQLAHFTELSKDQLNDLIALFSLTEKVTILKNGHAPTADKIKAHLKVIMRSNNEQLKAIETLLEQATDSVFKLTIGVNEMLNPRNAT